MTVHVTIELEEAVKASLDAVALATGRDARDLLLEAARRIASDEAAFLTAVDAGLASLEAGERVPHDEVVTDTKRRRAERDRAA